MNPRFIAGLILFFTPYLYVSHTGALAPDYTVLASGVLCALLLFLHVPVPILVFFVLLHVLQLMGELLVVDEIRFPLFPEQIMSALTSFLSTLESTQGFIRPTMVILAVTLAFSTLVGAWFLIRHRPMTARWLWLPSIALFASLVYSAHGVSNYMIGMVKPWQTFWYIANEESFRIFSHRWPAETPAAEPRANIVFIIGESLSPEFMHVYGAQWETSPELDALVASGEVIRYDDALAVGTFTLIAHHQMLSFADYAAFGKERPTLFQYAKQAGFRTAYFSARNLDWGSLKQVFAEGNDEIVDALRFIEDAGLHVGVSDSLFLDEVLLPFMRTAPPPWFYAYQMNGQHPPLEKTTPPAMRRFDHPYLNSVLHTDTVVARIMREVDDNTWVFFISDHGALHHDRSLDIPLLIRPPKNLAPAARARLQENATKPVTAYDVVHTMISLMGYRSIMPLTHASFALDREVVPSDRVRFISIDYHDLSVTRRFAPGESDLVRLEQIPGF